MRVYLLAFSVAVLSSAYWPCLSWSAFSWSCAPFFPQLSLAFFLLGIGCLYRRRCPLLVRASLVFALGLIWAAVWGAGMKAQQLPLAQDKTDYVLVRARWCGQWRAAGQYLAHTICTGNRESSKPT